MVEERRQSSEDGDFQEIDIENLDDNTQVIWEVLWLGGIDGDDPKELSRFPVDAAFVKRMAKTLREDEARKVELGIDKNGVMVARIVTKKGEI